MRLLLFFISVLINVNGFSQPFTFPYTVSLTPISVQGFNGLHSYAFASQGNKVILIGGRKDGMHARQPFNAFPANNNNADIILLDLAQQTSLSVPLNSLPLSVSEQLQSTNTNFYQENDTLYIIGGYSYTASAQDHITHNKLTAVHVSSLIQAIESNQPISPSFEQLSDTLFGVTGGQLGRISNTFYLVGGHRFNGRYNPMGNATYVQQYVNGYRTFQLKRINGQLTLSNVNQTLDQFHLHRRDYNLLPHKYATGERGYLISAGVFQYNADLPFLYPVEINESGYQAHSTFNQFLSHYHCAKAHIHSSANHVTHTLFFGGMSQYQLVNNVLVEDQGVPFVKTISRLSRDDQGNFEEVALPVQMPQFSGSSAEFIPYHSLQFVDHELLDQSQFMSDSTLIGHIVGGINSPEAHPFNTNNTGVTSASAVIYEVWLKPESINQLIPVQQTAPFDVLVSPNPAKSVVNFQITVPYKSEMEVFVTDAAGKLIDETYFEKCNSGKKTYKLDPTRFKSGKYTFNFLFDARYVRSKQVIIQVD
jgi:hypothetical protein